MTIDPLKMTADQVRAHNAKIPERRKTLANLEDQLGEAATSAHNPGWAAPEPGQHDPHTSKPPGPESATPAQRRRSSVAIQRNRLVLRDEHRREWTVSAEYDESYEELIAPQTLGLSVDKVRVGDEIRFYGHERSYRAEHLVVARNEAFQTVTTVEINYIDLADKIANALKPDYSQYRIEEVPGAKGSVTFRIMYGHHIVQSNFSTRAHASLWLEQRKAAPPVA